MQNDILHKKMVSHQSVLTSDLSNKNSGNMLLPKIEKKIASHQCVVACNFLNDNSEKMLIHTLDKKWFLSSMYLHMLF